MQKSMTKEPEISLGSEEHKESLRWLFFKDLPVNQEIHRSTESTDWKIQQKIQKLEKMWVVNILFELIFWQLHFEQDVICIRHLLLN